MSELTIYSAINAYITAQIGNIPMADIANVSFIGDAYVPEATTPYLSVSMPAIHSQTITTGTAGILEWRGILQIAVKWPLGGGLIEVTTQQGAIRGLFPNGSSLVTDDNFIIRFIAGSSKPLIEADAWLTGPVQIPWFLHEPISP